MKLLRIGDRLNIHLNHVVVKRKEDKKEREKEQKSTVVVGDFKLSGVTLQLVSHKSENGVLFVYCHSLV